MSYWSLRRTAERAAAGHELARANDDTLRPAGVRLPDWTPVPAPVRQAHAATVGNRRRSLRERAADLERTLWTVPELPAQDPREPSAGRVRVPATW